ncbi:hypothetical protein [Mycobacterium tuberculosis]|uniref:hypothetical protein n=1 Tax=Mycobacterium tuberculosis TaxID=1773 RepID=UPI003D7C93D6
MTAAAARRAGLFGPAAGHGAGGAGGSGGDGGARHRRQRARPGRANPVPAGPVVMAGNPALVGRGAGGASVGGSAHGANARLAPPPPAVTAATAQRRHAPAAMHPAVQAWWRPAT